MIEPFLEAGKLSRFPFPLCSDSIATSKWMPPSQGVPGVGAESESEVTQSCPTLCDPVGCSLPGSPVHGILQARILEWVAISFSRGSYQPRDRTQVSCIAGRRFNLWATREVLETPASHQDDCMIVNLRWMVATRWSQTAAWAPSQLWYRLTCIILLTLQ